MRLPTSARPPVASSGGRAAARVSTHRPADESTAPRDGRRPCRLRPAYTIRTVADGDRATRSQRRLAEELDDDRIVIGGHGSTTSLVVEEMDYTRSTPMFEGRRPMYGAIITGEPLALHAWDGAGVDLIDAPSDLGDARRFADGRASYLVRNPTDPAHNVLACFDRPLLFEADVVLLQEATGALVVQRTPVFGVTRLFQDGQVVSWDGGGWTARATAHSLLPALRAAVPDLDPMVADGLLTLALHWLSPARAGATLAVLAPTTDASLDTSSASTPPALTLTNRRHFPPLLSCLLQRDLATLIDLDGALRALGVGLLSSGDVDSSLDDDRGMRHRSARRWSVEHPEAVIAVVSSDGPVTVYLGGEAVIGRQ